MIPAILGSVRNLRGRGVLAVCLGLNDCVKERLVPYASTIFCFSHRRHLRWKWIFQEQNWLFWRMSRLWTHMLWYLRCNINNTVYLNKSFLPSFGLGANTTLVSNFVQMISIAMVLQRSYTVKKRGGRGCWLGKGVVNTKTKFWYLKFECEWISRLTSIHKSKSTQFISSNLLLITQIFHS